MHGASIGRMSTTRWSPSAAVAHTRANTGAQYLSASPGSDAYHIALELVAAGLLVGPLPAEAVAPHSRCFEGSGKRDFRASPQAGATSSNHALIIHDKNRGGD
eukprot:COSAG01_NODE_8927_length_2611_cov_1.922373_1_plen_103_part_00